MFGSLPGLIAINAIGFVLYFGLQAVGGMNAIWSYEEVFANLKTPTGQFYWFMMNWTEPNFYGGLISSSFLLGGSFVAWRLAVGKSKWAGFEICYGNANLWPWIFASQVFSLLLTLYAFQFITLFDAEGTVWIPSFIVLVSVPASMLLLYGPSLSTFITVSVLGAAICTPVAYWLSQATASLNMPGAVNNVLAMAVVGLIAGSVCNALPWIKKVEIKKIDNSNAPKEDEYSATWLMRRTIADLAEPLFYGNDLAAAFLLVGVILEWILNPAHATSGAKVLPAILLSQLMSGSIGVFLYTNKYKEKGWYATYVPVVCVAPACVLMFGATLPVIVFSSVLSAIISAPFADYISSRLPPYIHGTVGNVTSMALCTALVAGVMYCTPWF
jgi:hypothetical protein